MFLAKLKANALLLLAGLAGVLAFLLKLSTARSAKLKHKAETFKAQADHMKVVAEKDVEIDEQTTSRRAEVLNEIKEKRTSSELSRPNDW